MDKFNSARAATDGLRGEVGQGGAQCRYFVCSPPEGPYLYCDEIAVGREPYCTRHARLCFNYPTPATEKERIAEWRKDQRQRRAEKAA